MEFPACWNVCCCECQVKDGSLVNDMSSSVTSLASRVSYVPLLLSVLYRCSSAVLRQERVPAALCTLSLLVCSLASRASSRCSIAAPLQSCVQSEFPLLSVLYRCSSAVLRQERLPAALCTLITARLQSCVKSEFPLLSVLYHCSSAVLSQERVPRCSLYSIAAHLQSCVKREFPAALCTLSLLICSLASRASSRCSLYSIAARLQSCVKSESPLLSVLYRCSSAVLRQERVPAALCTLSLLICVSTLVLHLPSCPVCVLQQHHVIGWERCYYWLLAFLSPCQQCQKHTVSGFEWKIACTRMLYYSKMWVWFCTCSDALVLHFQLRVHHNSVSNSLPWSILYCCCNAAQWCCWLLVQMQAASAKGWRDIASVFTDKPSQSVDSDTALSPDDQSATGITGYGSRSVSATSTFL